MLELSGKRLYECAPLWAKGLCKAVPYSLIAGRYYRQTLRLCERLDRMARAEVLECQRRALEALLEFATAEVPFYQRLRPVVEKYDPFEALREFPIISKLTVQQHFREFVPQSIDRIRHHVAHTSGSSGNQLEFLEDASTYSREMAYMHSQWRRVGYKPCCRKATFRDIVLQVPKCGVFWQLNPIHNELQFSPFHMSEENLGAYVKKFLKYRPEFVHGYASAVATFAAYLLQKGLCSRIYPIKAVLLGGEGCLPDQRARITEAFNARIYSWYGHSERLVLGGECECSPCYHVFPTYGVVEIIGDNGCRCKVDEEGEIVGTGFLNRSMPLIRYRTDDYAVLKEPQCECGRHWDRFSDVLGRRSVEGCVVGRTGAKISITALETPSSAFRNVIRFQYYQSRPGEMRIRILPSDRFSPQDAAQIVHVHKIKLLDEMEIAIDLVDEIPLTPAGKQRWIVSEVNPSSDRAVGSA